MQIFISKETIFPTILKEEGKSEGRGAGNNNVYTVKESLYTLAMLLKNSIHIIHFYRLKHP